MTAKPSRAVMRLPVNGEEVAVRGIPHLRCPNCDECLLSLDQVRLFRQTAFEIYRTKYALLGPAEIRGLRETLGLTQAGMARLLRLGGNTISRWEAGRNVQTAAMDVLLRMLRDLPGSVAFLRKRAA
jgi:putative zinc finger/helix-turn-helix YgiT family protein